MQQHTGQHILSQAFMQICKAQTISFHLGAKILADCSDTALLFGAKSAQKASLLFICSEDLELDMAKLLQTACSEIDGRGGGRPNMAQGGGPGVEKLEMALQRAVAAISQVQGRGHRT